MDIEAGGIGVVEQHVCALADLRERRFLGRADVVEVAGIADQDAAFRLLREKTALEALKK